VTIALIVDHLWQSTLFALIAAFLTLLLRSNAARSRYWIWLAASIKFLIPFSALTLLGTRLISWQTTSAGALPEVFVNVVEQITQPLAAPDIVMHAPPATALPIGELLLALWALGCGALLARWLTRWTRIRAVANSATTVGIEAAVVVKSTPALWEPGVVGILRPILLLPHGIEARLTSSQLRAVLAHELCHVRRRDNLTAAIHMVVEAVFWFHPLVWWIGARLVEERERACDEAVVQLGNAPQTYAEGILKVCQFYMESKLTCVAGVSGASLKKRIEVIMSNRIAANLTPAKKILLASVTAAAISLPVVVGLATSPQASAQNADATHVSAAFDEVKITQTTAGDGKAYFLMDNGKLAMRNIPLRAIVAFAYGVEPARVVGGPDWLDRPAYDIAAHTENPFFMKPGGEPVRPLVKAMLANRFSVQAHTEVQQLPAFVLRVDAGGPKLKSVPSDLPGLNDGGRVWQTPGQLTGMAIDLKTLAHTLSGFMGRPVVDKTGLTGHYDFALAGELTPETLPAALRKQLGLTIESEKTRVDVVVVDSVQPPMIDSSESGTAERRRVSVR
jgi:uncharacterized protein (TIGR03435 family)